MFKIENSFSDLIIYVSYVSVNLFLLFLSGFIPQSHNKSKIIEIIPASIMVGSLGFKIHKGDVAAQQISYNARGTIKYV